MPERAVAVLMGGISHERDVSLESGRVVLRALFEARHRVRPIVIEKNGRWRLGRFMRSTEDLDRFDRERGLSEQSPLFVAADDAATILAALKKNADERIDVAFLALHGAGGEDGAVQGLLEWAGIPYTASGVRASVAAIDKCLFKALMAAHDVRTAPFVAIETHAWRRDREAILARGLAVAGCPAVIKASDLGSSFGVRVVREQKEIAGAIDEAASMSDRVLWERFIEGRELTCPIMGDHRAAKLTVFPVIEIVPKKAKYFDFESKYSTGGADEICPAPIPDAVRDAMQAVAERVHRLTGCEGVSRTDAIWDGTDIWVLETNTIPGMTAASLLPKAAKVHGWSLPELFTRMAEDGIARRTIAGAARETSAGT